MEFSLKKKHCLPRPPDIFWAGRELATVSGFESGGCRMSLFLLENKIKVLANIQQP